MSINMKTGRVMAVLVNPTLSSAHCASVCNRQRLGLDGGAVDEVFHPANYDFLAGDESLNLDVGALLQASLDCHLVSLATVDNEYYIFPISLHHGGGGN